MQFLFQIMQAIKKLSIIMSLALPCLANATDEDQELADEFVDCSVIASYMSTVPKPTESNYEASKRGWQRKALTLNGAARLLTSQDYVKQRSDAATEAFILKASADRDVATTTQFRSWMDKIDSCNNKLQANINRIMKSASSKQ